MPQLALIQTSCTKDPDQNLEQAIVSVREAASRGAEVILLQELFLTHYFCHRVDPAAFSLAEPVPGPTTHRLRNLAKELGVVILAPLFERADAGLYFNTLAVIDADGALLGRYRKMHIPDDPGFHEKYYFTPGDLGYKVFNTRFGRIGTLICWDQWFPEAARITAMKGAELLVYPTAIATLPEENEKDRDRFMHAWKTIQQSHAIANSCYIATANRCGEEEESRFWGHSFVCDPFGSIMAEAGADEEILMASINPEEIELQRREWPFFRDRRIDSYGQLLRRWAGVSDDE